MTSQHTLQARVCCAILALLLNFKVAQAIVVRHDVADAKYRITLSEFPALVYLPGEGHGVLIAPQWIVTAAHAAVWRPIREVTVLGVRHRVVKVIVILVTSKRRRSCGRVMPAL